MPSLQTAVQVSSAEIVRQFGRWQDHAAKEPVVVTHHGRGRVVLLSADRYSELVEASGAERLAGTTEPCSAERADQLMEHVDQGFIAFAADMTVTAVNTAACSYLKAPREALIGYTMEERLPGIHDSLGYANLFHAAKSGSISTFEMPSYAYEDRWLLFHTFPLDGGAACLFRDITDELEARRRADARTATLAALAAHGGIGRARLSARGTFNEVDSIFAGFAGFTPDGLARARLTDVVTRDSRAATADAVEAVLEGEGARVIDVQIMTKAGTERAVRIGLSTVRSHSAAIGAVVVMTTRT